MTPIREMTDDELAREIRLANISIRNNNDGSRRGQKELYRWLERLEREKDWRRNAGG